MTPSQFNALVSLIEAISDQNTAANFGRERQLRRAREDAEAIARGLLVEKTAQKVGVDAPAPKWERR